VSQHQKNSHSASRTTKNTRALETTSISPHDLIKMELIGPKKQKKSSMPVEIDYQYSSSVAVNLSFFRQQRHLVRQPLAPWLYCRVAHICHLFRPIFPIG